VRKERMLRQARRLSYVVSFLYSTKGLENPPFLGKKLQDIRWKEKDWFPIFMGMTEGRNGNDRREGRFTLTLTLSPQGRGEDSITQ